ncbi:DUF3558 family protein [Actinokineospora auranticolor]|uniref:Uncharacterized protein DUF3558 n=1 Tax=Actinokineospora auranticolor TaxID=155976 RepID=A0A2S6GUY0_9PSEU|nr:DUF3558 family protein [Actinokineospora auranticolor]PPK69003.1 uncharacterized protein DUF3558 [Actinokineospora auranticolor]
MRRGHVAATAIGALALLAGCGAPVAGNPVPAAGFWSVTSVTPTVIGGVPLSLDGVDLCSLLTEPDLKAAGGLVGAPRTRSETFPDSCGYPLGGGATDDYALVAFYKPLDQVRRTQPAGHEENTLGYPTWLHCAVQDGYRTCTATVAVRGDRSLLVAVEKRDTPEADVLRLLQPLTERAIERLPRA